MFKKSIVLAGILIVVIMTAGLLSSYKKGLEDARLDISQQVDAGVSAADGKEQTQADDAADDFGDGADSPDGEDATSGQSPICDSPDPQTNIFCELGYNEVRSDAPIHIHFAEALPSNYGGCDANWEWESRDREPAEG